MQAPSLPLLWSHVSPLSIDISFYGCRGGGFYKNSFLSLVSLPNVPNVWSLADSNRLGPMWCPGLLSFRLNMCPAASSGSRQRGVCSLVERSRVFCVCVFCMRVRKRPPKDNTAAGTSF